MFFKSNIMQPSLIAVKHKMVYSNHIMPLMKIQDQMSKLRATTIQKEKKKQNTNISTFQTYDLFAEIIQEQNRKSTPL